MRHFAPAVASLAMLTFLPGRASSQAGSDLGNDTVAVILPTIVSLGTIRPFAGPAVGGGSPARLQVLERNDLRASGSRWLGDVLPGQPGFSTYDDLGSPHKTNLSSRGFFASGVVGLGQGIAVFVDGVRQNEPDAAQVNFDLLPLDHVQQVEILAGNGSLLGRNALGGAINLITRRGAGAARGVWELTAGSHGTRGMRANVGGGSPAGFTWYGGAGYQAETGWRQVTGAEQMSLFLSVERTRLRSGLRLQTHLATSWAQTAGSLPESVIGVAPDSNLSAQDYEDLHSLQISAMGFQMLGRGRVSASVYGRWHGAARFNANQPGDPDVHGDSRNRVGGGTADYRIARLAGTVPVHLRVGVDGSASSTEVELFADSTKFGGGRPRTTLVQSPVWDLAGFVTTDVSLGAATFSAGGRYDYVRAPFYNRLDPTRDTTQTFARFNPRVGLDVRAGRGISLFGSIGAGFRAPSVIEIACADPEDPCPLPFALGDDPPIDPVTTVSYEAGFRHEGAALRFSVAAYRVDVRNDIYLFPYDGDDEPSGSTIDGYFGNLDATRREGLELSGRYGFGGMHEAHVAYAWTRATFQSEAEIFSIREDQQPGPGNTVRPGDRLPLVPDHQWSAGLRLAFPAGWRVSGHGRWVGRQYLRGDEANHVAPLDGYFTADLLLGYARGSWDLSLLVRNLFDQARPVFGGFNINQGHAAGPTLERFLTPAMPRQVRLGVARAFGGNGGSGFSSADGSP